MNDQQNKKSRTPYIIITLLVLFIVGAGITISIVRSKIKPEEIRKTVIAQVKRAIPHAEVQLGEIDFSIGANVTLSASDFSISYPYKNKKIDLFKVASLKTKIPLFTILTGGGRVDINLDKPLVNSLSANGVNLWSLAMKKTNSASSTKEEIIVKDKNVKAEKETDSAPQPKGSREGLVVPLFVANSSINLNLIDLVLTYGTVDKLAGSVEINKFAIKDLGLKKDAAYELNSLINISNDKGEKTSLRALLIGEFNLRKYLDSGELSSKSLLSLSEINLAGLGKIPYEIKNNIGINLKADGALEGSIDGEFDKSTYRLNYHVLKDKVNISDLIVDFKILDLMILEPSLKDLFLNKKGALSIKGKVKLDGEKIYPSIDLNSSESLSLNAAGTPIGLTFSAKIDDKKVMIKSNVKVFEGEIDSKVIVKTNINSPVKEIDRLITGYSANLDIIGLNFTKDYLQKMIYPPQAKGEVKKPQPTAKTKKANGNTKVKTVAPPMIPLLPNGKLSLNYKKIKLGDHSFAGSGNIITKKDSININKLILNSSAGSSQVNAKINVYRSKIDTNFKFSLTKFNVKVLDALFPAKMSGTSGVFNGAVQGNIESGKVLKHDINIDLKGAGGELKGIDLKEYAQKIVVMVKKIPGLKDKVDSKKGIAIDANFKVFELKGRFKEKHYSLNRFNFLGFDKNVDFEGNGNLYPTTKREGQVYVNLVDERYLSRYVEAYAGTKKIPILFKGKGLELSADYQYTIKRLSKNVLNNKKKKIKKKTKKKIESEIKKLFKEKDSKKINNLLKGLF